MSCAGRSPEGVTLRDLDLVFDEFCEIIREGNFKSGSGWGGLGFGGFYGAMTFQGIIPYYYDALHPKTAIELNRCIYNQMGDNPRTERTVNNVVSGPCRDGREDCEDCRERDIDEIKTAHFTLCYKPWTCTSHGAKQLQHELCRKMHHEWFRIRQDFEKTNGYLGASHSGNYDKDHFLGYCKKGGDGGYIGIDFS